jgi:hypothetical protein
MASLHTMAESIAKVMLRVCASGSAGANILLFELMDINLAKGIQHLECHPVHVFPAAIGHGTALCEPETVTVTVIARRQDPSSGGL